MAAAMTPNGIFITKVSGVGYAYAATGGNLTPSDNGMNCAAPTGTTASTEDAKRPHLRLVR